LNWIEVYRGPGLDMRKQRGSQQDDLAVDVWSEGEWRGEVLQAVSRAQRVQRVQRHPLPQLLLPRGESLDVHELAASAQRVHPACPALEGPTWTCRQGRETQVTPWWRFWMTRFTSLCLLKVKYFLKALLIIYLMVVNLKLVLVWM